MRRLVGAALGLALLIGCGVGGVHDARRACGAYNPPAGSDNPDTTNADTALVVAEAAPLAAKAAGADARWDGLNRAYASLVTVYADDAELQRQRSNLSRDEINRRVYEDLTPRARAAESTIRADCAKAYVTTPAWPFWMWLAIGAGAASIVGAGYVVVRRRRPSPETPSSRA